MAQYNVIIVSIIISFNTQAGDILTKEDLHNEFSHNHHTHLNLLPFN